MNSDGVVSFEPSRLVLARDRAGVTQRALADEANITVRTIQGYESGAIRPSREILARIANFLGHGESFFEQPPVELIPLEAASFRALSKASARTRNKAVASGTFAVCLFYPFLSERFELPDVDIPDLRNETPAVAAEVLRQHWGIGQRPVSHMVSLLESRGARVFSLSEDCEAIDAFSLWRDGTPFVFLNSRKTAERSIFDAAHELGHLVLHRHGVPQGHDAENEADRFASCFLLPEAAIRADAPKVVSVPAIANMKQKWRASTAAIGRRLHDLELMTDYSYTQFNKQLAQRGRKAEPAPLDRETSVVLRKVLAGLAEEGLTLRDIAKELHLPVGELRALTFGVHAVDGGARSGSGGSEPRPRSPLRLVR